MPSRKTTALAAAMVFCAAASAEYYIDPESVEIGTREMWCDQAQSACPLICSQYPPGSTQTNDCDAETLGYSCICGNGMQPNVSEYSMTIPYFKCTEWGTQCVNDCPPTDNICQSNCREDHPCGALNPTQINETETSTSTPTASATPTGDEGADEDGIYSGLNPTGAPEDPDSGAISALEASSAAITFALMASVGLGVALL